MNVVYVIRSSGPNAREGNDVLEGVFMTLEKAEEKCKIWNEIDNSNDYYFEEWLVE